MASTTAWLLICLLFGSGNMAISGIASEEECHALAKKIAAATAPYLESEREAIVNDASCIPYRILIRG